MKIKQKVTIITAFLVLSGLGNLFSFTSPLVLADPAVSHVVCADGKRVEVHASDKPPATTLNDKDYDYACRNNNGYKHVDATVVCKDNSMQDVYKNLADPKDELTKADKQAACKGRGGIQSNDPATDDPESGTDACKVKTSIIPVDCSKGGNPIWGLLLMAVNILTAGIGIVAVGGIIYASILWTTAEDKNAQIVKSKEVIFNVVVGMVAFALLWAFLQFLIPGGVFKG